MIYCSDIFPTNKISGTISFLNPRKKKKYREIMRLASGNGSKSHYNFYNPLCGQSTFQGERAFIQPPAHVQFKSECT